MHCCVLFRALARARACLPAGSMCSSAPACACRRAGLRRPPCVPAPRAPARMHELTRVCANAHACAARMRARASERVGVELGARGHGRLAGGRPAAALGESGPRGQARRSELGSAARSDLLGTRRIRLDAKGMLKTAIPAGRTSPTKQDAREGVPRLACDGGGGRGPAAGDTAWAARLGETKRHGDTEATG